MSRETRKKITDEIAELDLPHWGISISGERPRKTEFASTWLPWTGGFIGIEWRRQPTEEERNKLISAVSTHSKNPIQPTDVVDFARDRYRPEVPYEPPELSDVMGYYWPAIWAYDRPGKHSMDFRKIHEMVSEQELGKGIRIKVYRFGFFVFDFSSWEDPLGTLQSNKEEFDELSAKKMSRIAVLNCHVLCICTAYKDLIERGLPNIFIFEEDVISCGEYDKPFSQIRGGGRWAFKDIWAGQEMDAYLSSVPENQQAIDAEFCWKYNSRQLLRPKVVEKAFELLDNILGHTSADTVTIVALLAFGCKAYRDHNYNFCLVACWTIIEKVIKLQWDTYVRAVWGNRGAARGEPCEGQTENFTAEAPSLDRLKVADIIKLLILHNVLPARLQQPLDNVRRARNKWMHELVSIKRQSAIEALTTAQDLVNQVRNTQLNIPIGTKLTL